MLHGRKKPNKKEERIASAKMAFLMWPINQFILGKRGEEAVSSGWKIGVFGCQPQNCVQYTLMEMRKCVVIISLIVQRSHGGKGVAPIPQTRRPYY